MKEPFSMSHNDIVNLPASSVYILSEEIKDYGKQLEKRKRENKGKKKW